ncbi:MAG: Trm112 family protein [Chromatiales bacterium]|nr:Trm112 family protein [Chromatiales bacterium]
MDKKLLDIICCPVTQLPLQLLDTDRLQRLNAAIAAGVVKSRAEEPVADALEEALVTRDGRLVYPVRDGIPVLLEDAAVDLRSLPDDACA